MAKPPITIAAIASTPKIPTIHATASRPCRSGSGTGRYPGSPHRAPLPTPHAGGEGGGGGGSGPCGGGGDPTDGPWGGGNDPADGPAGGGGGDPAGGVGEGCSGGEGDVGGSCTAMLQERRTPKCSPNRMAPEEGCGLSVARARGLPDHIGARQRAEPRRHDDRSCASTPAGGQPVRRRHRRLGSARQALSQTSLQRRGRRLVQRSAR